MHEVRGRSEIFPMACQGFERLLVGQILGHYSIIEKIGAGGMGEVYRAHDEHLDREVAIKVLPPGTLTDEASRKRFYNEAIALSRLNHPNIATVHDFDTQQGVDFLVMEYIPGITLSDKLGARPLAEKEVVALGTQLAEGLSAAHEHGVIHRDLKPGNLRMTSDGRLKILDFGLAKRLCGQAAESTVTQSLSETRTMAGTLPYMAPEQLLGREIDARTDIHAAGSVMYEMATGQRPFAEANGPELIAAILGKPLVAPKSLNSKLSSELGRIIEKCLEKESENRYQSAKERAVDLRRFSAQPQPDVARPSKQWKRWALVSSIAAITCVALFVWLKTRNVRVPRAQAIHSLVVLPFSNLSGDPAQEYLPDGMTEALTAELSQISSLKIISRTSAMHYKGSNQPLPQIARELNVDGIIEGSVARSGNRVRVTAQLINAASDTHLWAQSYEHDIADVIPLEKRLALAIAHEVTGHLTTAEETALTTTHTTNPKAYDAYLHGRYLWNERTPQQASQAVAYFEEALREDPNFALAYSGLADHYSIGWGAWVNLPLAENYARKAVALDPNLAEAHASLGIALQYQNRFTEAATELKRAVELNPNYAMAHHWYAMHLLCMGRVNDALAENDAALRVDPFSVPINNFRMQILLSLREYDEAIEQAERNTGINEANPNVSQALAQIYWLQGRGEEAIAEERKTGKFSLDSANRDLDEVAKVYASRGVHAALLRAAQIQARTCEKASDRQLHGVVSCDGAAIASKYALGGDKERALYWLRRALPPETPAQNAYMLVIALKAAPEYETLRSDARFQDLLRQLGLPQ